MTVSEFIFILLAFFNKSIHKKCIFSFVRKHICICFVDSTCTTPAPHTLELLNFPHPLVDGTIGIPEPLLYFIVIIQFTAWSGYCQLSDATRHPFVLVALCICTRAITATLSFVKRDHGANFYV